VFLHFCCRASQHYGRLHSGVLCSPFQFWIFGNIYFLTLRVFLPGHSYLHRGVILTSAHVYSCRGQLFIKSFPAYSGYDCLFLQIRPWNPSPHLVLGPVVKRFSCPCIFLRTPQDLFLWISKSSLVNVSVQPPRP